MNAELFFEPCEFIKHEKRNEIERPWEHNNYFLFNHEYWPSKIIPSKIKTKKIAIDLYTFFNQGRNVINRFKISNDEFKKKLKKQISNQGFEPLDIFHIDNSRGCKFVISDYRDLMNVNMKILSEVDAFIGLTRGPAWKIDYEGGDGAAIDNGVSFGNGGYAAFGGLPHITIPYFKIDNFPVGISIIGRPWSDKEIIGFAAALEK